MTSATRRTSDRRAAGFTLLEIIVVLSIMMLVMGGGIASLYFNRDEAKLSEAGQEIELLAKRARTIATLRQQPYALEFTEGRVGLMPYSEAVIDPGDREGFLEERIFQEQELAAAEGEPPGVESVRDSWQAEEPDMLVLVKRWSNPDWIKMDKRERQVWRFDPNGICEPLAVRIEMEKSWMQMRFHPLTAGIAESEKSVE